MSGWNKRMHRETSTSGKLIEKRLVLILAQYAFVEALFQHTLVISHQSKTREEEDS